MPLATAAEFSNQECIQATPNALSGALVEKTSTQPVEFVTIVFFPAVFRTIRTAMDCPHPAQAVWPDT